MKDNDMTPERFRKWKALMSAYDKCRTACILELAQSYLDSYPDDGAAWYISGEVLTESHRYPEAAHSLRKALRFFPKERMDMVFILLGKLYEEKGSFKSAEKWYQRAVKHDPKRTQSLNYLGCFLTKRGRFSEAKRYYRRSISWGRDACDEAYYNLGVIYIYEGKYPKALEYIQKALEIDPKYEVAKRAYRDLVEVMKINKKR